MNLQLLFLRIITGILLLLLISKVIFDLNSINPFPEFDTTFKNGLWHEFISTILFGLMLWGITYFYQRKSDFEKNKQASKKYFDQIIKRQITNSFKRSLYGFNPHPNNHKLCFDNSHVNNLYDTITNQIQNIYRYREYNSDDNFVDKLIDFVYEVEDAYILAESIVTFLRNIQSEKKYGDWINTYFFALYISQFEKKMIVDHLLIKYENLTHLTQQHCENQVENYIESVNELVDMKVKIIKVRNKLIKQSKQIEKLLKS